MKEYVAWYTQQLLILATRKENTQTLQLNDGVAGGVLAVVVVVLLPPSCCSPNGRYRNVCPLLCPILARLPSPRSDTSSTSTLSTIQYIIHVHQLGQVQHHK